MDYQKYAHYACAARALRRAETVFTGGTVLNVFTGELLRADVAVEDGVIVGVGSYEGERTIDVSGHILCPGFIDAHLHLESTLVSPPELVENAVRRGTTTYIVDPHESANVSGAAGIDYILDTTEDVPANVYVMMPSCVPAVSFELNGCAFTAREMARYLSHPRVLGLGEVMDSLAVVSGEAGMMEKLALFSHAVCDGHAPFLNEKDLSAYALAGIRTDHECTTFEYAMQELRCGMHIHIREGSAAKNLEAIVSGIVREGIDTANFSFCTDDRHVSDIRREGHIDHCVRRAIALGIKPADAVRMATINTARLYGLKTLGAIAPGYQADMVLLEDLDTVQVSAVYHKGRDVSSVRSGARTLPPEHPLRHTINFAPVDAAALALPVRGESDVIGLVPGQIVTEHLRARLPQAGGMFAPGGAYSKLAVIERHHATGKVGVAALSGFGIQNGAIALSVSHDSHNICAAGDNDADILAAVEALRRAGGGYVIASGGQAVETLPLPIMGLMSDAGHETLERTLKRMIARAHAMGVPEGIDPFVTLSFIALPVIPALRLTPMGLYDTAKAEFCHEGS